MRKYTELKTGQKSAKNYGEKTKLELAAEIHFAVESNDF